MKSSQFNRRHTLGIMLVVTLVLLAMAKMHDYSSHRSEDYIKTQIAWPKTKAEIVSVGYQVSRSKEGSCISSGFHYRYRMDQKSYNGRVHYPPCLKDIKQANQLSAQLPYKKGQTIQVNYNPSFPKRSVFNPERHLLTSKGSKSQFYLVWGIALCLVWGGGALLLSRQKH